MSLQRDVATEAPKVEWEEGRRKSRKHFSETPTQTMGPNVMVQAEGRNVQAEEPARAKGRGRAGDTPLKLRREWRPG